MFWSFSRYSGYVQCPFKAKLTFLEKLKEPEVAAMVRGNQVHLDAEGFIKGTVSRVTAELKSVADDLKKLKKLYTVRVKLAVKGMAPVIEETWAFTRTWELTVYNDWAGCWLRIKVDAAWWADEESMVIDDWKTGKFREEKNAEYLEQLELYALGALLTYPHLERVTPRLRYVDEDLMYPPADKPVVYVRADIPRLKKAWEKRTRAMLADMRFAPRPGWYCAGCYFSKGTTYGFGKEKKPKPAGPCKF